jgi:hypothetical protein
LGTSYVAYKGFGFWTRDAFLENWLETLLDEMGKLPVLETWQESLMGHWRTQTTIDGGVMSLNLDQFLTDTARETFVLLLAKRALERSGPPGRQTGQLFVDLLAGRLKTTVSSPVDYLADSGGTKTSGPDNKS